MSKDLYRNTEKYEKKDSNGRRRRNKKRGNCIIGVIVLGLFLAACGAPSGEVYGNPDGRKDSGTGVFDMVKLLGEGDTGTEPKRWFEKYSSCEVQELSGYLYDHTFVSVSAYASAEITIKNYEGEQLKTRWYKPSAFQFSGEADVIWRFYNSLAEMEAALNEAAIHETDGDTLHFLYYTFPIPENDHALDLYHNLQKRFDTDEHPLSAWSADHGKVLYYAQESLTEEDGYEFTCLQYRNSRVNLYVKDGTAYGLTLMNASSEDDDETLEYVFEDVFQRYCTLVWSTWLSEENLYWIDHNERLTELEDPKRSFLEVRGIDEGDGRKGVKQYFGLLVEADYELPLTENGRMLSLHFSLAKEDEEDEEEDTHLRYYLRNGFCMDESYDMTVTDMETGEGLQECTLSLSIELPDTITYPDLNGDGYADMRVGAPTHASGAKAAESDNAPPSYLLWEPQTEQFVRKTKKRCKTAGGR